MPRMFGGPREVEYPINDGDAREIKRMVKENLPPDQIASKYGITVEQVVFIFNNPHRWKDIFKIGPGRSV